MTRLVTSPETNAYLLPSLPLTLLKSVLSTLKHSPAFLFLPHSHPGKKLSSFSLLLLQQLAKIRNLTLPPPSRAPPLPQDGLQLRAKEEEEGSRGCSQGKHRLCLPVGQQRVTLKITAAAGAGQVAGWPPQDPPSPPVCLSRLSPKRSVLLNLPHRKLGCDP